MDWLTTTPLLRFLWKFEDNFFDIQRYILIFLSQDFKRIPRTEFAYINLVLYVKHISLKFVYYIFVNF